MYQENLKQYWPQHMLHFWNGFAAGWLVVNGHLSAAALAILATIWKRQELEFEKRNDTPGIDLAYVLAGLLAGTGFARHRLANKNPSRRAAIVMAAARRRSRRRGNGGIIDIDTRGYQEPHRLQMLHRLSKHLSRQMEHEKSRCGGALSNPWFLVGKRQTIISFLPVRPAISEKEPSYHRKWLARS